MAANTPAHASSSQADESSEATSIYLPSIACDVVEICVDKATMFRVHENVLRQSPFFENVLKPEWVSAREGKPIDLEEDDPDTFAAYVQWLYSHQVDPSYNHKWAKQYVLGEKMMDIEYQDDVLYTFMQACEEAEKFPTHNDTICTIYDGTPQGSPARKLLVDYWRYSVKGKKSLIKLDYARNAPADFVNDLLLGFYDDKDQSDAKVDPFNGDRTVYMLGSRKEKA